eukprot:TRINITY_DN26577_c0_g1_i1.p1 TRINITY_DN26577_c0_g1~~TRINITY_DN26577_c0_g1_i1.p1  ORF type:complete len:162 (+),score=29.91 TRINITY_DN26577_c0_g1_i1:81-566(+)
MGNTSMEKRFALACVFVLLCYVRAERNEESAASALAALRSPENTAGAGQHVQSSSHNTSSTGSLNSVQAASMATKAIESAVQEVGKATANMEQRAQDYASQVNAYKGKVGKLGEDFQALRTDATRSYKEELTYFEQAEEQKRRITDNVTKQLHKQENASNL